MGISRNSRREFLRNMACVACSGGAAAMVPQLRMMGTAMAATSSLTGYKALVCMYLQGGNDSWNLVVPYDSNGTTSASTSTPPRATACTTRRAIAAAWA